MIYGFTPFHSILIVTFGEVISCFFSLSFNFDIIELIIDIVTYSFEILGVLVFIEAIELNFCKLNINLKKNIIFRSQNETDSIIELINKEENDNDDNDENDDNDNNDIEIEIGDVRSDANNDDSSENESNLDYQSSEEK